MKYLLIVCLLTSRPVLCDGIVQQRTVKEKATTQMLMDCDASAQAAQADAKLNEVYRKLLARAKNQKEATSKIVAAEKAWIAYRDAYMEAMYPAKNKQAEYGSMYPMDIDLLRTKLAQTQTAALKKLLQQYSV